MNSKGIGFHLNKNGQLPIEQRDNLTNSFSTKNYTIDRNRSEVNHLNLAKCVKND